MRYTLSAPSADWTAPTRRSTLRAGRRLATTAAIAVVALVAAATGAFALALVTAATVTLLPAHPAVLLGLTAVATVALYTLPLAATRAAVQVLRATPAAE